MTRSSRRTPQRRLAPTALAACLALLLALPVALAQDDTQDDGPPPGNEQLTRGESLFRIHCVGCHGAQARGDGPMAPALRTEVPDLTLLTQRHGGQFPREQVHQSIDGRVRVKGHGLREMPVWGLSFQQREADSHQEQEVQERLRALVTYLESIQRED